VSRLQTPQLLLIDVDGTLVDSVPDLTLAVDAMMRALDLPERGEDSVRQWVGNGIDKLVKRALTNSLDGEPDEWLYDKAQPIFREFYSQYNGEYSRLYPGVKEGLNWLKTQDIQLGCITNKAERFSVPLLKMLGLHDDFGIIVSGDTLAVKKPDPAPLLHAAKHFGVAPADAMLLGDSQTDVEAAHNAEFGAVVCVSYGYNHGKDIRLAEPDAVIDSFAELSALLD
jgi:phosphoglycolate phosphatase